MKPAGGRVALIFPSFRPGGVERVRLVLAEELLKRGYDVDLVVQSAHGDLRERVPAGARIIDLAASGLWTTGRRLRGYFRKERPDGAIASIWALTVVAALALKSAGTGTRLVLSDHNPLSAQYRRRGRLIMSLLRLSIATAYRLADARVAVSAEVAGDVASLGRLGKGAVTVINNPIGRAISKAPSLASALVSAWQASSGKKLLAVGTLKDQKNYPLLINAFAQIAATTQATLLIAGGGPECAKLEALIAELGMADRILLPGFLDEVDQLYASADLFVLSSNYEGFGNVVLEALRAGTPIVATDCGGPREILAEGRYGRLVPVRDVAALASAITEALRDPVDQVLLKKRAADFDVGKVVDAYLELLFPA
jgi:glycosyltransferase involved in cell wall biosynthesis